MLNEKGNTRTELGKIISNAMITLKKLDLFWIHSSCPIKFKLLAVDTVIRSKVLYGMDTAQLNETERHELEVFQLKTIRTILNMKIPLPTEQTQMRRYTEKLMRNSPKQTQTTQRKSYHST